MRKHRNTYGDRNLIGRNVVRMRQQANLSQTDLLEKLRQCGYPIVQSKLSSIEGQLAPVTDIELRYFALALGTTLDALVSEAPNE